MVRSTTQDGKPCGLTADHQGEGKDYDVDSLSGATLTTNGVDRSAQYWLNVAYKPFLENLRKGEI